VGKLKNKLQLVIYIEDIEVSTVSTKFSTKSDVENSENMGKKSAF